MSDKSYNLEIDHLALGLTRSPMFMGVNLRVFFANIVLGTLICIDAHTMFGIPLFILFHFLMVKLSIKEPNFLYINIKVFLKTPPTLNYWYWGKTNSYEPW